MVQEAIDGLTDQQLADLELQESGLVSGQNAGAIAYTPFAQRMNPQPAPAPEPEEPVALSEFQLNQLEEENYRRMDYVMTPQEFDQYWDRRDNEDREVGRFLEGLGQGAAGLIGMVPETGRELQGAMVGMVTDPVNQVQRNVQTGAEIIRKGGINLVQLFDWVGSKVDDLATGSKRAEAINAGIMDRLIADGKVTGDREQDEQIYQAALAEAREAGAYTPTLDQAREDKGKAYERYVREKALERDFANVSEFKTGEGQMSVPTSAGTYQITDEQPMPTISTLGSMVVDPLNALPLGAGALSKARVLRRIANLSEKPMLGAERVASGLADVAERVELGISTRLQDITGLTQKQQAALGAGVAGTAVYVDSATDGGGGITKAVLMAGAVMPALHYGGGLLRKVGSAAGGAATIVREAGVGGLGVARAEAASSLAGNAAVPERYRKFFTGYVDGTDSTLKRVAQDAGNPEALRRGARFADRMGATQVARAADDAVSGAVTAGIVGSPFAALQPDAERAGEVMGGILTLGGVGGLAGGVARRAGTAADADIARMFADVQAVGGNVEAFARLPHATLDRLSAMQGVLAGKVDFVPLTGDEYRMNADIAQNGGEATAGVFLDRDANNRARVFINLDGKTATEAIAPHEIGHAILTSNILDGQPRNDLRNLVNQQYGPGGVESRGREYIARMVDADLRQGVTGEAPTVLTDAEMKAMDGGKTMDDIVADRAKDPAERDRLINERVEEFRQRSIDKGEDALDWARDEIIAETFASEAPAIDFRAIRRDAMFPRLAESMLSAGGRVLEVMGARLDPGTGKLMDNPSVLFRDNPLFQDRIMQKRVREYVRSYDQYLAGLEEAGAKELRGVELARSSKPEDLARSTHVKLRDEGNGVLENDFMVQRPDGTYTMKAQKTVNLTENARSAQIKTLYDARKFVPVNSQEFGKRKVNGREVVGGPVLPPQFDFFTNFPKYLRPDPITGDIGLVRKIEASREDGGSWDIDVNVIGTGSSGRYRVINLGNTRAVQRETVPYGWIISKANHLLAASLDLNAFRASAMKAINKGDLGLFNNDMRQVEADLKTYLANHRNGRPGEMTIGQQKRDMLNGLIGTGTAVQRTANPLYSDLNPRGSIRTWRVDRLNDAKPTGRTGYFFDYDKINNNRMPSALPQAGMAMPDGPVRGERADIPLNPRARQAAFISDRGEVRATGRATHFETNEDLGPDFLAIGAGHLGEDGFFRFGSQSMDEAMGDSPATSSAAAGRYNQSAYDQGRRPSSMLEEPPGLERPGGRGQTGRAMPDTDQPRRYVSMEKFIEEAGDDLGEVLPNAYANIEFNDNDYPTHLVSFADARNSMYRSRVPSKQFFDWLHSDEVMDGLVFDKEYTPARPGEGAGHTRESYQAVIDRLREISLKPSKRAATGGPRGQAMPDVAVVPERFTGTGQEPNRQSRFAQPPPFFARFPIESYERGGKFFDAQSGDDLTGRSYGAGFIDVSSGKPRLFVDGDPAAQPAKSGRTYRTNLFKQKAGWKWISDNAPATSTIVSVEGGGRHIYSLRADFEGGVDLARYSDKPSEPRLRPTARGELSLGNEVGRISIRGKEHPVYDGARIAQPSAPRGQAMPDDSQPMRGQAMADVGSAADETPRRLIDMPQSALKVLHANSAELPKPAKKLTNATVALTLADVAEKHNNGIITSSNITPEQKSDLMILGADEAEAALKASGKNAGNWYSVAIEAALGIAGVIYRELSDAVAARSHAVLAKEADPVKAGQFALRLPLAITSQNMTVKLNTRASNEQFNIFLKTGKFDPSIAYGEKAKSISGNLDLANVMIDELGSVLALEDFVSRTFTVRELEAEASSIAGRKITIAGRKDDIVNGAAIFGPKIGQGFLQNLMGKFDPVTIDLWMRRTWGRWTGDVVGDGVTAQRLARLVDQSRKSGRKLPDSIKRLRTTMRSMGETKTGKAKKPELTMSEDVEARLEAEAPFRKEVEAFAKEVNAEFQGLYKLMSDVMSPALAKKVQDAIERAERLPDQADAILSDVYNAVVREQSRVKQQLDKKWSGLSLDEKREMAARRLPGWADVKPQDRAKFIKKSKLILKGDWLEMQHQAEGRTAKLGNPQKNLIKPAWANAAKSIVSELNPIDIPSDMDRRVITEVVNGIREELERRGHTVTNADVQAILWYPEKDLWAKLRGEEESILKQSYDDEFINIAEGLGLGLEARKVAKQIRGY